MAPEKLSSWRQVIACDLGCMNLPPPRKFIELYRDLMPDDERAGRHAIEWIA